MDEFGRAFTLALHLIIRADPELLGIVGLSLRVSLSAALVAFIIGAPVGALLAITRFRGRTVLLIVLNALLGLPPVVVGLVVYLLVSRSGPLGGLGLLFVPGAMVLAQSLLALPIVAALVHMTSQGLSGIPGRVCTNVLAGRFRRVRVAPAP